MMLGRKPDRHPPGQRAHPCEVEVFDLSPEQVIEAGSSLLRPGTFTCAVGSRESELLAELVNIVIRGAWGHLPKLTQEVRAQHRAAKRRLAKDGRPLAAPQIEIRYNGKPLVQGLFYTETLELAVSSFAFNGGTVAKTAFSASAFHRDTDEVTSRVVVFVNQPLLSDVERAVLDNLPGDLIDLGVALGNARWPLLFAGRGGQLGAPFALSGFLDDAWDGADLLQGADEDGEVEVVDDTDRDGVEVDPVPEEEADEDGEVEVVDDTDRDGVEVDPAPDETGNRFVDVQRRFHELLDARNLGELDPTMSAQEILRLRVERVLKPLRSRDR